MKPLHQHQMSFALFLFLSALVRLGWTVRSIPRLVTRSCSKSHYEFDIRIYPISHALCRFPFIVRHYGVI